MFAPEERRGRARKSPPMPAPRMPTERVWAVEGDDGEGCCG